MAKVWHAVDEEQLQARYQDIQEDINNSVDKDISWIQWLADARDSLERNKDRSVHLDDPSPLISHLQVLLQNFLRQLKGLSADLQRLEIHENHHELSRNKRLAPLAIAGAAASIAGPILAGISLFKQAQDRENLNELEDSNKNQIVRLDDLESNVAQDIEAVEKLQKLAQALSDTSSKIKSYTLLASVMQDAADVWNRLSNIVDHLFDG